MNWNSITVNDPDQKDYKMILHDVAKQKEKLSRFEWKILYSDVGLMVFMLPLYMERALD